MDIVTLGAARSYTDLVAAGLTSVSVSGTTVTFTLVGGGSASITLPTPANGVDGTDGTDGISITNVAVNASKHIICTMSDGSTVDAGLVPTVKGDKGDKGDTGATGQTGATGAKGDKGNDGIDGTNGINGTDGEDGVGITSIVKSGNAGLVDTYTIAYTDGTTSTYNVTNGANITKVSDLENDTGFITNVVTNLVNYYGKTDIYTKAEIGELLRNIGAGLSVAVVAALPTEDISLTTIYLIQESGSNSYIQWMYISSEWANLGSTTIDLSAYYTGAQVDTKLSSYVLDSALTTVLGDYTPTANLADVALSNSYNDLDDLPVLPDISNIIDDSVTASTKTWSSDKINTGLSVKADTADLADVATTGAYSDLEGTPTLATVATSGSYNDLTDKPTSVGIDDTQIATDSTWSSSKVSTELAGKVGSDALASVATSGAYSDLTGTPSALPADGGNADTVGGYTVLKDVPANAVFTDTTYSEAATSASGLMSSTDKVKLDGIEIGANKITVDSALSDSSENPVQNKIVQAALSGKANAAHTHTQADITGLETALAGKAAASHTHALADVTGLQSALNDKANGIHSHATSDVNGLDTTIAGIATALDGKASTAAATQSANGLMSSTDKTKLDGVAAGANAYTHPAYTARTGVPTANQTPAFGGVVAVTQPVSDATGHITGMNSRNITIPSTAASASAAGLVTTGAQTIAGAKTFNGSVIPAGASAIGTAQARKIYAGTADMTAGTSALETGAIYIVYE